jgi:cAMP-binding proteins - catabolite gene activator and regulatory subunit of cAMP-dependent protein kinases
MRLIAHNHPARIAWNILILGAILAFLFIITYRVIFGTFSGDAFYYCLNFLFLADIGVNFMSKVKLGHVRIDTPPEIARNYLGGWFIVDAIAAFPFELIIVAAFGGVPSDSKAYLAYLLLQSLTLVKLLKAGRIFRELQEALDILPSIWRLLKFGFWGVAVIHLMGVGWILIGASEPQRPHFDQYLRAIYWVTTTIATIGYGDYYPNHDSNAQIFYTIIVQIFGVGMYSFVIANVSSLVSNLDVSRAAHQRKLEEVNSFMRSQRLPSDLQERVRDYYSYRWTQQRGVDTSLVLDDIPHGLSQEILMFLNREVLNRVDIFKDADELFIRESVQLLKPRVFLPGEYIIREGEYADCMYFLASGELRILVRGNEVAKLGPGSPFGETALIDKQFRNASVVSSSYSTGYRLDKQDFEALRSKYPDFDRRVRDIAERRKREDEEKARAKGGL